MTPPPPNAVPTDSPAEQSCPPRPDDRIAAWPDRHPRLMLALVLGVITVWFWLRFPPVVPFAWDSGVYVAGAESLATGRGYRLVTHDGSPKIGMYPPLQSAFLALSRPGVGDFERAVRHMHVAMVLLGLATVAMAHRWLIDGGVPVLPASAWCVCFGVSPYWFSLVVLCRADVLFTALALVLLLLRRRRPFVTGGFGSSVAWGTAGGLLYLTKTAAMAPILAGAVVLAWATRHRRPVLQLGGYLLPIGLALGLLRFVSPTEAAYSGYFSLRLAEEGGWWGCLTFLLRQSPIYLLGSCYLEMLFPMVTLLPKLQWLHGVVPRPAVAAVPWLLGAAATFAMATGALGRWRTSPAWRPLILIVAAYLLELLVWPYPMGWRGVTVILPILWLWAWDGVRHLAGRVLGTRLPWMAAAFLGLSACVNAHWCGRIGIGNPPRWSQEDEELREICGWIREHVDARKSIASSYEVCPVRFREYAGRTTALPAFMAQFCRRPDAVELAGIEQVDYWLLNPYQSETPGRILQAYPDFELVRSSRHQTYHLIGRKASAPPPSKPPATSR